MAQFCQVEVFRPLCTWPQAQIRHCRSERSLMFGCAYMLSCCIQTTDSFDIDTCWGIQIHCMARSWGVVERLLPRTALVRLQHLCKCSLPTSCAPQYHMSVSTLTMGSYCTCRPQLGLQLGSLLAPLLAPQMAPVLAQCTGMGPVLTLWHCISVRQAHH